MNRIAVGAGVFAAIFALGQQSALCAECSWGTPENRVIESSTPDGVSMAYKELNIGQPFDAAEAVIRREYKYVSMAAPQEFNVDGGCKLKVSNEISATTVGDGRIETLTAQFGSPRLGRQLLAFQRHIRYEENVALPLVSEIVNQLYGRFGEPSALGTTFEFPNGHMPVYYFAYKDRKKIRMDLDAITSRGGWHPCRRAANFYPPRIFESTQYEQCDFIVHVYFGVMNPSKENSTPDPQHQRYKQAWIQFLDLKRAGIDLGARESWITGLKRQLDEAAAKRTPTDQL